MVTEAGTWLVLGCTRKTTPKTSLDIDDDGHNLQRLVPEGEGRVSEPERLIPGLST